MDEQPKQKVTIADLAAKGQAAAEQKPAVAAPLQQSGATPAKQLKTENLFFNVMPKIKAGVDMTQPTLKVETVTDQPKEEKPNFFKKYKWSIIITSILVIAGTAGYFILTKIITNSYKPDTILVSPSSTAKNPSSTSTPQIQVAGFTTPQDWRNQYFPGCSDPAICGDTADPDHDGLTNIEEYKAKTDPNNPDSDQDGLSDGDEINVFASLPLNAHSGNNSQYNDGDYIKGGYDFGTGKAMSKEQIAVITSKMKSAGLHEPTLKTLGNIVNSFYNFSLDSSSTTPTSTPINIASSSPASASSTIDQSISAKQSRDTKRSDTIKNIGAALVKYQSDNNNYPQTPDFITMFTDIKPYLKVATNPVDPLNISPYVYSYSSNASGTDFTLSFYSEVAGAQITKNAAEATQDSNQEQADVYDSQRETDMEDLRTALLLYSNSNVGGNQIYVFPTKDKYATALVPAYIPSIPKDPVTGKDYDYEPSADFSAFTLKSALQDPPTGNTGYICNQIDDCTFY